MKGFVYIVGAGPGKIELLTLRALEVIKEADVIVHDALIGEVEELIKSLEGKIIINAGKRSGKHAMKQEEINELLVKLAREGKKVVRLKGGDPFVFGRGGEEAEYLAERGIEFEVVPGVTSAISVPAAVGIPVTDRRFDPAVVFITGRESRKRLNWKALSELNATIVVLMGAERAGEIARNLISNGKDPETAVAVIEKGFSPDQNVIVTTLRKLGEISISPPAIIVIGNIVKLRERIRRGLRGYGEQ